MREAGSLLLRERERGGLTFQTGSVTAIPVPDGSVSLLTLTEVLEHLFIEDFKKAFSEISRKLESGGYFLASIPFNERLSFVSCPECGCIHQPHQHMIFEISQTDIQSLCKQNGMEVVAFYRGFNRETRHLNRWWTMVKRIMLSMLPDIVLSKLFPMPGASGFLAKKVAHA
jgi:ubiquinone/menaquinone biosynthesis C-methylase UbiE